jgi:hypothetical protein
MASRRTARRTALALGAALIGLGFAVQPFMQVRHSLLDAEVEFGRLVYLPDSLYLRIVNRIINPAELRFESKLEGNSDLYRCQLMLGDVDAPGPLPNAAPAIATLYFRSGEEGTIHTTAYAIDIVHFFGPPQRLVGIRMPEDDEAAFVPTCTAIRLDDLVRVVVIVPRPATGWREI